ncbi:MAG: hypothetical protein IKT45_03500 [Lachnospiraceae bacterium]|nr:hypothetical protein [Lachnospiraceae bacterium]
MPLWAQILVVVLILVIIAVVALYFYGSKLQRRQVEQEEMLEQMEQTVSILVIDKKIMPIKEAALPPQVLEQTPWYMKRAKVPVVKAKIGKNIMVLMAENKAYEVLPVKTEAKVVLSGMYIREVKSVRGQTIQKPEQKKKFWDRFKKNK